MRKYYDNGPKSFVVKILTSNPFAIKILQATFAGPAPVKPFGGGGGGGYPPNPSFFPKRNSRKSAERAPQSKYFCARFPQW